MTTTEQTRLRSGIYRRVSDDRRVVLFDTSIRDGAWVVVLRLERLGPQQRPYRLRLTTFQREYQWERDA